VPAIDTRGPARRTPKKKPVYGPPAPAPKKVYGPPAPKVKPKQVYGPPAPKKPVYGPPAPKVKPKQVYGPPAPKAGRQQDTDRQTRKPRAPTPAERTNIRISAQGAKRFDEATRRARPDTSAAAVESYKQTPAYVKLLQESREVALRPDSERRRNMGHDGALGILHPWTRVSPKEEKRERDFKSTQTSGVDVPRTDKELSRFMREGKFIARGTATGTPGTTAADDIDKRKGVAFKGGTEKRGSDLLYDRKRKQAAKTQKILAPALKVADLTMRLNYTGAAAASAAIRGKNVPKAALEGLTGKDKATYSKPLRELGVGKGKAAGLGFVADIALDPTTYLTGGYGAVAKAAARKAGKEAFKRAVEKGASENLARIAERRAGTDAARRAESKGSGVYVKVAGKEIPGVRRATAATGRGTQAVARKVTPRVMHKAPGWIRTGLRKTVRPSTRPSDVEEQAFNAARQADVEARASVAHAEAKAETLAVALKRKLPADQYEAVMDAIERGDLSRVSPTYRKALKETGGDRKKAEALTKKRAPKEHALLALAHDYASAKAGHFRVGRRAGAIKGKAGNTREFLSAPQLAAIGKAGEKEVASQGRRVEQLTRHEIREAGRKSVAEEAAKGTAAQKAAVATERNRGNAQREAAVGVERGRKQAAVETAKARGQAKVDALREQHAADVDFERAHAGARVSVATPSPTLRPLQRELDAAVRGGKQADTTLRRANAHLKRTLARPNATRKQVASSWGKVNRAERRAEEGKQRLVSARGDLRAERQRTAGVAPSQHDRLLDAITEKTTPRRPAHVPAVAPQPTPAMVERLTRKGEDASVQRAIPLLKGLREQEVKAARAARRPDHRVEPEAPKGARLAQATARHEDRATQLAGAKARREAAEKIPQKTGGESHGEYLQRVIAYADAHALPIVRNRAQKLLDSKPTDVAKGYTPRDFEERILKRMGAKGRSKGLKVARITAGHKRADQRRLAVVNPERIAKGEDPFSTNFPLVSLNHAKSIARAAAQGEFHKALADAGRKLIYRPQSKTWVEKTESGIKPVTVGEDEAVYKLGSIGGQFGLHETKLPRVPKSGQYVVLNQRLVEEATSRFEKSEDFWFEKLVDRGTGAWKQGAIASVAFHVRNAVGDVQQHFFTSHGWRIPGNMKEAYRATSRASEQARLTRPAPTDDTLKVAGKDMPMDDFLKSARRNGVLDAGQVGREMKNLTGHETTRSGRVRTGRMTRAGRTVQRWVTNRENMFRLATFKAGLDTGLTEKEAAAQANKIHIDYGDLSEFERRVLRRVFPFYTWTARSTPLMIELMLKHPGKVAALEKVRQEIGAGFTGETSDQQLEGVTKAAQRQIPFIIKIGDEKKAISFSPPTTLLNNLPTGINEAARSEWFDEVGRFGWGMVSPAVKDPFEWRTNKNLVTKAEIENARTNVLTAAPSWVQLLPDRIKQALDVVPPAKKAGASGGYTDKQSGEPSWGWRGKADWGYDQLMLGFLGQAAQLGGQGRSQATTAQGIGGMLGARIDPVTKTMRERAAKQANKGEVDKLTRRLKILNEQNINADHPTPEYTKLRKRLNALTTTGKKADKMPSGSLGFGSGGGGGGSSSGGGGGSVGFGSGGGGGSSASAGTLGF
jgi:hypothetical protein